MAPLREYILSDSHHAQTLHGVQKITIHADDDGQRIDNFIQRIAGGLPKSRLYKIIRKGEVRVNGGRVKPEYRLQADDVLRLPPMFTKTKADTPTVSPRLQQLLVDAVLYEDDDVLVLNKPEGLAVHGGSGVNIGLIEALRQVRSDIRSLELVHRLDRGTSGCLLITKKRSMLRRLHAQMREGHIHKHYSALVAGCWDKKLTEINAPLIKNHLASGERYVKVAKEGRRSVTQFRLERSNAAASLLDIRLLTGRTHQIRVHTQFAGHPIVGDDKYGDSDANTYFKRLGNSRLCLHARQLSFELPQGGQRITVTAPVSGAMAAMIEQVFA